MSRRPDFAREWYRDHFDPYKADRDKADAKRAAEIKVDRLRMGALRPNPATNAERMIRTNQTTRAKSVPVTLSKGWTK